MAERPRVLAERPGLPLERPPLLLELPVRRPKMPCSLRRFSGLDAKRRAWSPRRRPCGPRAKLDMREISEGMAAVSFPAGDKANP